MSKKHKKRLCMLSFYLEGSVLNKSVIETSFIGIIL